MIKISWSRGVRLLIGFYIGAVRAQRNTWKQNNATLQKNTKHNRIPQFDLNQSVSIHTAESTSHRRKERKTLRWKKEFLKVHPNRFITTTTYANVAYENDDNS